MSRIKEVSLIAAVASVIFFANLGSAKLWDRDEPRNAGCAREMMQRGDLITPIFNNELRDAKPVLQYWFIISAYKLFGVNEFSARFWSAALGVGTVLLTYFIGQRLFSRQIGILAAIILATSFMFCVASRAATPDSFLIFFSTAALAIFVGSTFPKKSTFGNEDLEPRSTRYTSDQSHGESNRKLGEFTSRPTQLFPNTSSTVLLYAVMSVGVLAKGPIGVLMPCAIIGMYLLISTRQTPDSSSLNSVPSSKNQNSLSRPLLQFGKSVAVTIHPVHFLKTCWSMRLLTAIVVVLLIAGPWYFLVGWKTNGDYLRGFFLREHIGRSTTSFEGHNGSILYYPAVMLVGLFPWSVFAGPVLYSLWTMRSRINPGMLFLMCWVCVQVGLFSIVSTKLPSYVTPCYPAVALIFGYVMQAWIKSHVAIPAWFPKLSFATLAVAGLVTVFGIGYVAIDLLKINISIGLVGLIPVFVGILSYFHWETGSNACKQTKALSANRIGKQRSLQFMIAGAVTFSFIFFSTVLTRVSKTQEYETLLVESDSPRLLGSYGGLEPTWVFYGGKPIYVVTASEKKMDLSSREYDWQEKPKLGLRQFLNDESGQIITRRSLVPEVEMLVSAKVEIVKQSPYFLKKNEQLVVIQLAEDDNQSTGQVLQVAAKNNEKRRRETNEKQLERR